MNIARVGIVGYGSFGALAHKLLQRFAPSLEVRVYSTDRKPDGKTFFSLAETAKSDAVILAVPIHAFEEVLKKALPLVRKDTVIVDVATVKVHPVSLLRTFAKGRRYLATHPVWGPESYEKRGGDISGFRIVMTDGTLGVHDYGTLTAFLEQCGFDVVEMSAEQHDKHLAETLFLTHFVGQLVSRAGFERSEIDTVSFGFLMDAVESVKNDEALFRDVFRFNPYCKDILNRIEKAEKEVRGLLESTERKAGTAIGISGEKGSFSEEAARLYARKHGIKKYTLNYLISVENVLAALEKGSIDLGIFPIENSTGGVVTEAVEAMAKHNFRIKKMFDIEVRQNLMVRKGVKREDVRSIRSHEQALRQCREYLKKNWRKAKIEEYEDTAKAAKDLAEGKLPKSCAVIASVAAAKIYKLKILESSIQDLKSNFTTFIASYR
jgi:prephenate dehydratase